MAEVGEYPTSEFTLASGLRVVLERGPDVGVAGVVLVVGAGSADEGAGKAGLAHLAEHLVFETRGDGELPLKDRLRVLSSQWNGSTDWDATTYTAYGPVPTLATTLEVLAEVLKRPLSGVNEADFRRELDIVQSERRLNGENGTNSESIGFLSAAVFPEDFPYAHPVAGTAESLDALVLDDARAFVRAGYTPSRATLTVSSPHLFGDQLKLITRTFGPLARDAAGARAARAALPDGVSPPVRAAEKAPAAHDVLVSSPTLLIGWPVPSSVTQRGAIPELLARMARGTFFYDLELRDVTDGSAGYLEGTRGDLFYLTLTLEPTDDGSQRDLQDLVHRASSRLRRGVYEYMGTLDLFERYKRLAATGLTYSLESIGTRATWLALSKQWLSSPGALAARDRELRSLTEEQVSAYIETYLSEERARAVLLRPRPGGAVVMASDRRLAPGVQSGGALPQPPSVPDPPRTELESWLRRLKAEEMATGTLSNGMSVIILNRPASVYHTVLVGFAGGEAQEDAAGVSLAELWSLARTRYEPSAQGLSVERYHTVDSSVELMRSTGSNAALSLSALRDRLEDVSVRWPPRELLDRLNSYSREEAQPYNQLARESASALLGSDPYGRRATSEQLGAVQPNDIQRFRSRVLRPENGVLVLVGNVPMERSLTLAEELLGSWARSAERSPPESLPKPVAAAAPRRIERDWPQANRAQIRVSCLLESASLEQEAVATMLARLLQQRLFEQLREQLGASYSVADQSRTLRGGTAVLEFIADASYEHFAAADAVIGAFAQGSGAAFSAVEFAQAQRAFAASYNHVVSTTDGLARAVFRSWVLGHSVADFVDEPDRALAVTLPQINAAAERCARHAVVGVLGDRSLIERARRQR